MPILFSSLLAASNDLMGESVKGPSEPKLGALTSASASSSRAYADRATLTAERGATVGCGFSFFLSPAKRRGKGAAVVTTGGSSSSGLRTVKRTGA